MIGRTVSYYQVSEKLGEGGMGVIYKAVDIRLGRPVALKFLSDKYVKDPEALSRFQREARLASSLNHPHICTIHDVGDYEGRPFIVMELLEGLTLKQRISGGSVAADELVVLAAQISEALEFAHAKGVLHRDIKPSNIIVTGRNQAKILDFGLARPLKKKELTELTESPTPMTDVSSIVGTVHYMAPEVLGGIPSDVRSDLWSLGVLFYEMGMGGRPFDGLTVYQVTSAILHEPPRPFTSQVPPGLQRVIQRCLAKDPDQRYQHASEVRAALETMALDQSAPASARPSPAPKTIRSLAVLPFENASGDKNSDYLSAGLTESIIYSISRVPKLHVVARSTVYRYKDQKVDPIQVGRDLNVGAVLTGRVAPRGNLLVVGTELIDTQTGWQLWGQQYSREFSDLLAIQEDISREIAEKLRVKLGPDDEKQLTRRFTENFEGYELYLKGRYHVNARTAEGLIKGLKFFQLAVEKDPGFALAYVGIADANAWLGFFSVFPPGEAFPLARAAAERACALDDALADAHASLGFAAFFYDWDWAKAEEQFRRSIQLDPEYAPAHYWYAWFLTVMNRHAEAAAEIELAAKLEPGSVLVIAYVGFTYYLLRRYDEAAEQFRKAMQKQPDFNLAHWLLGLSLMEIGKEEEALEELEKALQYSNDHPSPLATLGYLYGRLGWRDQQTICKALLERRKKECVSAFSLALCQVNHSEKEQVLNWLEQAVEERSSFLVFVKSWPAFDSLRADLRFVALTGRIGLPK